MKKNSYGFTIVELLIVIVVIGILAAITVVAYNGIQTRATNTSRVQEATAWNKHLQLYKATYGNYPPVPASSYCLGLGFPNGDGIAGGECRDYASTANVYHENDNTALMNELRKIGSLPSGPRQPVRGTVGPYITLWSTGYEITTVLQGGINDCPSHFLYTWDDGNGRVLCRIGASE